MTYTRLQVLVALVAFVARTQLVTRRPQTWQQHGMHCNQQPPASSCTPQIHTPVLQRNLHCYGNAAQAATLLNGPFERQGELASRQHNCSVLSMQLCKASTSTFT